MSHTTREQREQPSDQESYFRTDHLLADLRGRSVRGGAITLGMQALAFVVKLGSLAVLARLITREDFGLIFAVTAITAVIGTFRDFGLQAATQQRSEIGHSHVTALFWINVALSFGVTLLIGALTPIIVWLYEGDTRLITIVLAYAGMGIFDGLAFQHQAILRRQMRFTAVAVIEVASLAASRAAAIALAWYGAGYWALVAQTLVLKFTGMSGVWLACRWRPGLPRWASDIRPMLRFGRNLAGVRFIQHLSGNVDKVLIRRFVGEAATGVYGNAYRVLLLPIRNLTVPLSAVALPALSRLQNQPERFCAYYQKAMSLLATAVMPLVAFVFVAADPMVLVVLGPQWIDAAAIFRVLAPAALIVTFNSATGWVYAALGRTDRQIRWVTYSSLLRIAAVSVGVMWGALGVATATTLSVCSLWLPGVLYCFAESPLQLHHLLIALRRPALASLAATAILATARSLPVLQGTAMVELLLSSAVFGLGYVAAWVAIPGGRAALSEIIRLATELRGPRRESAQGQQVAAVEPYVKPALSR